MRNNKGSVVLDLAGKYIIIIIGIGVGASILFTVGLQFPSESQVRDEIMEFVSSTDYPLCRNYEEFDKIDKKDFKIITYALYTGRCGEETNKFKLDFVLSKPFLRKYLMNFNIQSEGKPLWIFRDSCKEMTGFEGFVVQGKGYLDVLYDKGSLIELKKLGKGVGICETTM